MFYLYLVSNFPNPFEHETSIVYELGRNADVQLRVYTVSGELVKVRNEKGVTGYNRIIWDGTNRRNKPVSSGVYLYVLEVVSGEERANARSKCSVVR